MLKERRFSVDNDFRTGICSKIFFLVALILMIVSSIFFLFSIIFDEKSTGFTEILYDFSSSFYPETILSISIILLAIGVIFYFFNCQFKKLEEISKEIENEDL